VAWSLDGKYLVSGSESGELICWDPQIGKLVDIFMQADSKIVQSSLFSKKRKRGRNSRRASEKGALEKKATKKVKI